MAAPQHPEEIFLDIDETIYRKADGLNQSAMPDLLTCPKRFEAKRRAPDDEPESDALLFGRLLHKAVLEPHLFGQHVRFAPDAPRNTKVGKEAHAGFVAQLTPCSIVVPAKMSAQLQACVDAIKQDETASGLLYGMADVETERSVFWREAVPSDPDGKASVLCKARLDVVRPDGLIIDVKTARDASPDGFRKAVADRRYDMQAAHYLAAARRAGVMTNEFVFIVVEKTAPYLVGVYLAGQSVLDCGEAYRKQAIEAYAYCTKTGIWPGYTPQIAEVEMPPWMWRDAH